MRYITLAQCYRTVFPYIYAQLTSEEPSAQYEAEQRGLSELNKVFHLVESDSFYPSFFDKAAYLLCSIAGSQYFSNGNKRLGVIVLTQFLIINNALVRVLTLDQHRKLLEEFFLGHTWEDNRSIGESEPLLLYNLAIVIGDRKRWGDHADFSVLKQKVSQIFSTLYRLPS